MDGRLLGVAVDAVVAHRVHEGRGGAKLDLHAGDHARQRDPDLGASLPRLGEGSVGVGEVGAVDGQLLHALVHGVGNRHRHAVVEVRLAQVGDRELGNDLRYRVVVGKGNDVRPPLRGNDGNAPGVQRVHQRGAEIVLLLKVVHPEHDIAAEGVARHVDAPDLIEGLVRELLRERRGQVIDHARPHANQGNRFRGMIQILHVALAVGTLKVPMPTPDALPSGVHVTIHQRPSSYFTLSMSSA